MISIRNVVAFKWSTDDDNHASTLLVVNDPGRCLFMTIIHEISAIRIEFRTTHTSALLSASSMLSTHQARNDRLAIAALLQWLEPLFGERTNDMRHNVVRTLPFTRLQLDFFPLPRCQQPLIRRPRNITAIEEVRPDNVDDLCK